MREKLTFQTDSFSNNILKFNTTTSMQNNNPDGDLCFVSQHLADDLNKFAPKINTFFLKLFFYHACAVLHGTNFILRLSPKCHDETSKSSSSHQSLDVWGTLQYVRSVTARTQTVLWGQQPVSSLKVKHLLFIPKHYFCVISESLDWKLFQTFCQQRQVKTHK